MAVKKLPKLPHIISKCITANPMGITVVQQRFQGIGNTVVLIKKRQYILHIFLHTWMIITSFILIFCPHFLVFPDECFSISVIGGFGTGTFLIAREGVKGVGNHIPIFYFVSNNLDKVR